MKQILQDLKNGKTELIEVPKTVLGDDLFKPYDFYVR